MSSVNHQFGAGIGGDVYVTDKELRTMKRSELQAMSRGTHAFAEREAQTANAALAESESAWRAKHPDRDERIRARADAAAIHIAMSRELDAMQEAGRAEGRGVRA